MANGWYPVEGKWWNVQGRILEYKRAGMYKEAKALEGWIANFEHCPVANFIPHGRPYSAEERSIGNGIYTFPASTYDPKYKNDGVAFLSDWTHDMSLFLAPNQAGKALPVGTFVMTPMGTVRIEDLRIGDFICGGDGKKYTVTGIFPQGKKRLCKMTFDKEELSVKCSEDHLWKYLRSHRARPSSATKSGGKYNEWDVLSAKKISELQYDDNPTRRGYIPNCDPVEFAEKRLVIHPYIMGVLIGDGCLVGNVSFDNPEQELVDRIASLLPKGTMLGFHKNPIHYSIKSDGSGPNHVLDQLRRFRLMGCRSFEKCIPFLYNHSSIDQRIELLRGLMDTDGSISGRLSVEYSTSSQYLADDVAWLVRSLGGKCLIKTRHTHYTKNGKRTECRMGYRLSIKMSDINPFHIKRKADRWYPMTSRRKERVVHKVEMLDEYKECICISVDSPDGTFLLDNFVVTHNTQIGAIKTILHIIPCNPNWDIFTKSGVAVPVWTGPKIWVIASYSWDNVATLWKRYRDWLPRSELRELSPNWGKYPGEKGKARDFSFGDGKPKKAELTCGSVIIPLCYGQQQCHWESFESDGIHTDEQIPKEKYVGWVRSTTTRGDYTPMFSTFTGHIMDDRPDTGAAGWIKREIWDNADVKNVARYGTGIEDVPECLITPKKRKELYDRWANPSIERSEKDYRIGVARYWGGWEIGGGMVFDEWNRAYHVIPPIWKDNLPPSDWTLTRVIDYGDNGVTCCAWFATGPGNVNICYRLLYERGLVVFETVKEIIERSGNKMVESYEDYDSLTKTRYVVYEEVEVREHFRRTIMDSRSGSQLKNGVSLIDLFRRYGLKDMDSASASFDQQQIPLVRDLLRLDYSMDHICKKSESGEKMKGAALLYFIDGYTDMAIHEIENLCLDTTANDRKIIARGQDDHAVDTIKYFASEGVTYIGDNWGQDANKEDEHIPTPYTGY